MSSGGLCTEAGNYWSHLSSTWFSIKESWHFMRSIILEQICDKLSMLNTFCSLNLVIL